MKLLPAAVAMMCVCVAATAAVTTPTRPPMARTLELLQQLQRNVPKVDFEHERLEDVLQWFRRQGLRNLVVDWRALELDGLADPDTEISLELSDMALGELLDWVLRLASSAATEPRKMLSWQAEAGVLLITTRRVLAQELVVRVYDIEALAQKRVMFGDAPTIAVSGSGGSGAGAAAGRSAPGGTGPGGGQSILQDAGGQSIDLVNNRQEAIAELIEALKATVEPQTWDDHGGAGSMVVVNGRLIVNQTLAVHEQLGGVVPNR